MAFDIVQLAAAMRKAVKRRADESDSENSIDNVTNRGNKLKKKAKFVHEGQLAPPTGPEVYKETIEHAGYTRNIISRRPVAYDEDGYEIDSEDEDEDRQELMAAANELYPYADVRIEELLAPLTRPADLAEHPTLSLAFKSKPLTELAENAREMVQKEKASLWKMKQLLSKLSGDQAWVPTEMMETADDIAMFDDGDGYREHVHEKQRLAIEGVEESLALKAIAAAESALDESLEVITAAGEASMEAEKIAEEVQAEDDVAMVDGVTEDVLAVKVTISTTEEPEKIESAPKSEDQRMKVASNTGADSKSADPVQALAPEDTNEQTQIVVAEDLEQVVEVVAPTPEDEVAGDDEEEPAPRRMRTRAQAQAASDENETSRNRSMTPESNASYIHPYFLAPPSAHPDRDMGLPMQEADDTRRLLQLYIQKQEEVCRGAQRLYEGLLSADRMRAMVLKWAKADGHIGEMSDGEDWYDKEEWGLTEDLKKGQDEEEEDAATTAKKTRTRRQ